MFQITLDEVYLLYALHQSFLKPFAMAHPWKSLEAGNVAEKQVRSAPSAFKHSQSSLHNSEFAFETGRSIDLRFAALPSLRGTYFDSVLCRNLRICVLFCRILLCFSVTNRAFSLSFCVYFVCFFFGELFTCFGYFFVEIFVMEYYDT